MSNAARSASLGPATTPLVDALPDTAADDEPARRLAEEMLLRSRMFAKNIVRRSYCFTSGR